MQRTLVSNSAALSLAALGMFGLSASPISPRAQDSAKTYSLAQTFKVGDIQRLKIDSKMKMELTTESGQSPFPGGDMNMLMVMKNKTVKINSDGTADMEGTVVSGKMEMFGQSQDVPPNEPVKMTIDKYGNIKNIVSSNQPEGVAAFFKSMNPTSMSGTSVVFPTKPVKVGESWTQEIGSPFGGKKGTTTGKLIGIETINGSSAYRISMDVSMPMEMSMGSDGKPTQDPETAMMVMTGKITMSGEVWVDASNGQMVKGDQKMKSDMVMNMKGPAAAQSPFGSKMMMKMTGTVTTSRVADSDAKPAGGGANPTVKKPF